MKTITTMEQLSAALDEARVETILARALAAEMEAELVKVKSRFVEKVKQREAAAEEIVAAVEAYVSEHRAEVLAEGAKSVEIGGHKLGFRDNGGAIVFAKGQTAKKVLERLRKAGGSLRKLFVRETPALNKEAMRDKWVMWKGKLQAAGVRLKHEELFFVELDVTTPKK